MLRARRGRCSCWALFVQGTCPRPVLALQRARARRGAPPTPRGGSGCPRDHRARLELRGSRKLWSRRCSSRQPGDRPDSAPSATLGTLILRSQEPPCLLRRTRANRHGSRYALARWVRTREPRSRHVRSRALGGCLRGGLEANARLAPVCVNESVVCVILAMYYDHMVQRRPPHHAQQLQ